VCGLLLRCGCSVCLDCGDVVFLLLNPDLELRKPRIRASLGPLRDELDREPLRGRPRRNPSEHDDALRDAGDDHVAGQPLERRRDRDREEQDRDPDEGAQPLAVREASSL
jgi:hypothetical protein